MTEAPLMTTKLLTTATARSTSFRQMALGPNVVAVALGLMIGTAVFARSALFMAAGIVVFVLAVLCVFKTPLGLVAILAFTSSIISDQIMYQYFRINVGPIHLLVSDLLLVGLLLRVSFAHFSSRESGFGSPLVFPILGFLLVSLLSTGIAVLGSRTGFADAIAETRYVAYYSAFFVAIFSIRSEKQIRFVLEGILLLSAVVSAAMIVQSMLGQSAEFLPGRVEDLKTQARTYADVTRIIPPGESVVVMGFIFLSYLLIFEGLSRFGPVRVLQWALTMVGSVLTYYRSYWAIILFSLIALFFLGHRKTRVTLIKTVWLIVSSVMVLILIASLTDKSLLPSRFIGVAGERFATLFKSETYTSETDTWRWRYEEYGYAYESIKRHPFIGIGLGAKYRPFLQDLDTDEQDLSGWLHNGHLWILVKTGVIGYFFISWLSLSFVLRGWRAWRYIPETRLQMIVLGSTMAYIGIQVGSIVEPIMMKWGWISLLSIMIGLSEVIIARKTGTISERTECLPLEVHRKDS